MVEIRSHQELQQWIADQPSSWGAVVGARAVMRSLPFISFDRDDRFEAEALIILKLAFLSWHKALDADRDVISEDYISRYIKRLERDKIAFQDITKSQFNYSESAGISASTKSIQSLHSFIDGNIRNAIDYSIGAANDANAALFGSSGFDTPETVRDRYWSEIARDCEWLRNKSINSDVIEGLATQPLWSGHLPPLFLKSLFTLRSKLLNIDESYATWIEWYQHRVDGYLPMFIIDGDIDSEFDREIVERIISATENEFWSRGAVFVNRTLQVWLAEARARVTPPESMALESEAVSAKLLESASPQARIVDGKLDAVPNTLFDAPQYSDVLSDLPSEMHAFLVVLEQSLPRNCPSIMRNCIKGYADELLVRGNRPIVNVLTGMASAIAAQFWIVGEGDDPKNPETWQVRNPEEWDSGTVDLFRTLFRKHFDLIAHFPLNAEREVLIASTPIDEIRASGATLLEPIQAINELIISLNKDGLATDNIVKIMEAHVRYARDVSGLPVAIQPIADIDMATPKRRFVLNSAGFYLHTYSILGSTASLASSPQVIALMEKLSNAAQVLLGFIR